MARAIIKASGALAEAEDRSHSVACSTRPSARRAEATPREIPRRSGRWIPTLACVDSRFEDTPAHYAAFRAAAESMIGQADLLASSLVVRHTDASLEDEDLVYRLVLVGWWRHVCENTDALLALVDRRHTVVRDAIMRVILDYTSAMIWLHDVGAAGPHPIEDAYITKYNKMLGRWRKNAWNIPDDIAELSLPPCLPITRATAKTEDPEHARLRTEFGNVSDQMDLFVPQEHKDEGRQAVSYDLYKQFCDYIHPSKPGAMAYITDHPEGHAVLPRAPRDGHPDVIHATFLLLQAGLIASPLMVGDPLHSGLEQAALKIGLDGISGLVPVRNT